MNENDRLAAIEQKLDTILAAMAQGQQEYEQVRRLLDLTIPEWRGQCRTH